METVVTEIARTRMEKDVNDALGSLGLFVTAIRFDESKGLSVIIELSGNEGVLICAS
ncbi:MAG: hypothetical protein N2376_10035 [Clostridia bacterium]|nr:hypothetical protein [Clostridia bacterium]